MELLLDTANIQKIKQLHDILPLKGVTTNPSILKQEGKIDFFNHLKQIRKIIGPEQSLHVQITATNAKTMIEEAYAILEGIDASVYIKIPVTIEGLKAIKKLKSEGIHITATAIYTKLQSFLAIAAGADYLAPYYNRMETLGIDSKAVIESLQKEIERTGSQSKILGASYKTIEQINDTFDAGAQAITVNPDLVEQLLSSHTIMQAVEDFRKDWKSIHGENNITALLE
ncbi:fructose-6-phosphate aldolase [Streptococcus halotolerans]|uniref:fructose-6-phosphate aldolase n=1 Tax=Streptococcus halotolerans TaxID=1814128 RepID=UPI000786C882|nr:fructose-6-phosphate aldolase [Streptococcus halotolerans]